MNVVKRRWPDLLIGLLVLLLLGGFTALLLGKGTGIPGVQAPARTTPAASGQATPSQPVPSQTVPSQPVPSQAAPSQSTPATTPPATASAPSASGAPPATPAAGTDAGGIPTIEAGPVTGTDQAGATTPPVDTQTPSIQTPSTQTPATTTPVSATPPPRAGGAVPVSEARTPTRNDYRISLGKYSGNAAQAAATAGVSGLGYTVHPIAVVNGVVAQVGPFATKEQATLALADIQRALPRALLYPPRNPPTSDTAPSAGPSSPAAVVPATPSPTTPRPATPAAAAPTPAQAAPSGPVYLQVGAFNSPEAAQTAVARVRSLGLDPSVNAPAGKLVTVVVGPFQGQALTNAEAKLQAGGLDSFRVR